MEANAVGQHVVWERKTWRAQIDLYRSQFKSTSQRVKSNESKKSKNDQTDQTDQMDQMVEKKTPHCPP